MTISLKYIFHYNTKPKIKSLTFITIPIITSIKSSCDGRVTQVLYSYLKNCHFLGQNYIMLIGARTEKTRHEHDPGMVRLA